MRGVAASDWPVSTPASNSAVARRWMALSPPSGRAAWAAVPVARTRTMPFSSLTSTPSLAAKSGTPRRSAVALGGTMLNTSPPWNSAICSPASM